MSTVNKDIQELRQVPEFQLINQSYPHIALLIELNWGHKDKILALIADIGVDYRGNRQGFPPAIFSAMMRLCILHDRNFIQDTNFHISGAIAAPINRTED